MCVNRCESYLPHPAGRKLQAFAVVPFAGSAFPNKLTVDTAIANSVTLLIGLGVLKIG
jgi:hypothetical protein